MSSLRDVQEGCPDEMGLEPSKTDSSFASRSETWNPRVEGIAYSLGARVVCLVCPRTPGHI